MRASGVARCRRPLERHPLEERIDGTWQMPDQWSRSSKPADPGTGSVWRPSVVGFVLFRRRCAVWVDSAGPGRGRGPSPSKAASPGRPLMLKALLL